MRYSSFFLLAALFAAFACVPQKKYRETAEERDYCKTRVEEADSILNEYNKLAEEKRQVELEERRNRMELESLLAANRNLHNSYMYANQRASTFQTERNEIDQTAAYEKISYEGQLYDQQFGLDRTRRLLDSMDYELYLKTMRLNTMEYDYTSIRGDVQRKNIRINDLEQMLRLRESNMSKLKERLEAILLRFSADDLSLEERGGRFYVTLSSKLLFPSGSARIDPQGREALRQVADALKANPDIDILVEGHTDTDGTAANNWTLSTNRAVAVTSLLTSFGVNPEKITAAGRGQFRPKATNATAAGKTINRRTEIILSPRLDELYEFLSKQ